MNEPRKSCSNLSSVYRDRAASVLKSKTLTVDSSATGPLPAVSSSSLPWAPTFGPKDHPTPPASPSSERPAPVVGAKDDSASPASPSSRREGRHDAVPDLKNPSAPPASPSSARPSPALRPKDDSKPRATSPSTRPRLVAGPKD